MLRVLSRQPEVFRGDAEMALARAPGRIDVMGGIADYSGSLVLPMPIREGTFAAVQRRGDGQLVLVSADLAGGHERRFELPIAGLLDLERSAADAARDFTTPDGDWPRYLAGAVFAMARQQQADLASGLSICVVSNVPEGKGVSSSAAVGVATLQAVAEVTGCVLEPRALGLLGQELENQFVGAPCGAMDQLTAACGRQGALLRLLCQPAEIQGTIDLPPEVAIFGIDSGARHSVGGTAYRRVRVAAFMGYRILAEAVGLSVRADGNGRVSIDDPLWHGYLANVTPSRLRALEATLPRGITGDEFLARYSGITDLVTRIEPELEYPVYAATRHAVEEHARVQLFAELLPRAAHETARRLLGELMLEAHASYSACGLGAAETDRVVDLVRELGPEQGLYGARVTGGGSGGTVAVLARADAADAIRRVAERHVAESGKRSHIFEGSSASAADFGVITLRWDSD